VAYCGGADAPPLAVRRGGVADGGGAEDGGGSAKWPICPGSATIGGLEPTDERGGSPVRELFKDGGPWFATFNGRKF
jgi:hypothetical protein